MRTLVLIAVMALATPAFGHGDAKHGTKEARPLSTEEHPFGREGDPKKASRTVNVDMSDRMRFTPAELTVKQGETVRFRVKNSGKVMHEMVIGTMDELKAHAEMMRKHPGMEHDEPYMAHVAPGKTETMVWQFTKPGEFYYGCLVPGHFEAGMIGKVKVAAQGSGYSGEEARDLKALSPDEVKQYLAGAGMGYAKPAELNRFPGPMHALEHADALRLSKEQRQALERLMAGHKAEARAIGAKLVEAERAVEALFRSGKVEAGTLAEAVRRAGAVEAEYRLAHLETHRRTRALLTEEQVAAYDKARGYAGRSGGEQHQHKHQHKHH